MPEEVSHGHVAGQDEGHRPSPKPDEEEQAPDHFQYPGHPNQGE
jgi:hypothetical protein